MNVIQQYYQLRKRHTQTRRAALVASMGKRETHTELQLAKTTEERQLLGDTRINLKIILKYIVKTYGVTGWVGSGFISSKDRTKNLQLLQKATYFETEHIKQIFNFLSRRI